MSKQTQWTSDDVPFLAFGAEGKTDKQNRPLIQKFHGTYLYSTTMKIKKRNTIVHRAELAETLPAKLLDKDGNPIEAGQEVTLFGSGAINGKLRRLPEGTPIRLTYEGEKDVGQDSPMKVIRVEWPKGTKLAPPPKVKQVVEREAGDDDDAGDEVNF